MYVIMVVIVFEHKHNTSSHVHASVWEALLLIPQVAISSTFFYYLISFLSNKICCVTTEPAISYRRFPSCKNSILNAVNSIFCLGRFSERKRTSIEMDKSCLKPFLAQCSFVWEIGGENNRQLDRCCPSCLWRTWVGLRFL